ncbi:MAG: helix-turn-helix domain-containing protein [Clostridia bacterium]|nr:helix-turn-helix domain-containing protein [Clostridia bacterium]
MGYNTLGDTIRSLRKRAGITQEELADGICSPVSVSRIENGLQMPSGYVLDALLSRLGTSTYGLCGVYYKTDRQLLFERAARDVTELIRVGEIEKAKEKFGALSEPTSDDSISLQTYLFIRASILYYEKADDEDVTGIAKHALSLTRPGFDFDDFRGVPLTVEEANILCLIMASFSERGEKVKAIRLGEELIRSLRKNESSIGEFRVMLINTAFLLSQILESMGRYAEALSYCETAESLSIHNAEQVLLPNIEFMRAVLMHDGGDDVECLRILKTVIPYMDLIKMRADAERARAWASEALGVCI